MSGITDRLFDPMAPTIPPITESLSSVGFWPRILRLVLGVTRPLGGDSLAGDVAPLIFVLDLGDTGLCLTVDPFI